jgi:hypothetical protein
MGFSWQHGQSRADLIAELTKGWESGDGTKYARIAHCTTGNCLWVVFEKSGGTEPTKRVIALYLLETRREKGSKIVSWGYKDMDESVHPYYYGCPLSYLDMVPDVACEEWRRLVRLHHTRKNQKLTVGQVVTLSNMKQYQITSIKPLRGVCVEDGIIYRIPRSMLTVPEVKEAA